MRPYVDYVFDPATRCATLTFDRPEVLNAIDVGMAEAFGAAVLRATAEPGLRLVVIRGAGRAFVAGGNLQRFADDFDQADSVVDQLLDHLHPAILALHSTPALVLACVQGVVAGAGLSLMLGCDLVLAAEDTRLLLAYNKVAASPDCGGTYFLPRRIGAGAAMKLMVGQGELSARDACALGMLEWCVAPAELELRLQALCDEILNGPSLAFGSYKALTRGPAQALRAHLQRERAAFCAATKTADFREGVSAFLARRVPQFRGC